MKMQKVSQKWKIVVRDFSLKEKKIRVCIKAVILDISIKGLGLACIEGLLSVDIIYQMLF